MKTRILTAIVSLAVFVGVLAAPPVVFTIAIAAVILIMLYECYIATKADLAMKIIGFASAVCMMSGIYIFSVSNHEGLPMILLAASFMLAIMIHMVLTVAEHGKKSYKEILANGFLTMYIVISSSCIWLTKENFGISKMLLIFVCAWSTDTFAYFIGSLFGKHKLIPHVSPKKTVEGAIGGIVGAVLGCFALLIVSEMINGMSWSSFVGWLPFFIISAVIFGVAGGVCSQLGDLVASAVKRDTGIKDFGWIFPGHGGFMDRFDSVIFIAPLILAIMAVCQL